MQLPPPIIERFQLGLRQRKCYGSTWQSCDRRLLPNDNRQSKRPLAGFGVLRNSGPFAEHPFPLRVVFSSEKGKPQILPWWDQPVAR